MLKTKTRKKEKKEGIDDIIETNLSSLFFKDVRKTQKLSGDDEKLMWQKYFKTKDKKIRDLIIKSHLLFAIKTANEFSGVCNQYNIDIKDLYQEALIGLVTASEKYTLEKNTKFISYAVWWVRQSILAYLSEYSREIRLPLNVVNDIQKQQKKNEQKLKQDEFVDTSDDIFVPTVQSIYSSINEDGDELIDLIPANITPPDNIDKFDKRKELEDLISNVLDEREKTIITMYYGFDGNNNCNLEDVGDELNLTKERVRQIKEIALKKLRTNGKNLFKFK